MKARAYAVLSVHMYEDGLQDSALVGFLSVSLKIASVSLQYNLENDSTPDGRYIKRGTKRHIDYMNEAYNVYIWAMAQREVKRYVRYQEMMKRNSERHTEHKTL